IHPNFSLKSLENRIRTVVRTIQECSSAAFPHRAQRQCGVVYGPTQQLVSIWPANTLAFASSTSRHLFLLSNPRVQSMESVGDAAAERTAAVLPQVVQRLLDSGDNQLFESEYDYLQ